MNILSVDNIRKSFNERVLFDQLTLGISQGEKVALVGINGCGKSTLLRIVAGEEVAENGVVSIRKGISMGYLPQEPAFENHLTIWQAMFDSPNEAIQAVHEYELALLQPNFSTDKLTKIIEKLDNLQAWDIENNLKQILGKLGIQNTEQKVGELSGGQRKRVALAKLLLNPPDFMILDEPTNHLDLDTIEWLEKYLATANQTVLMVTHDRYFLDSVTNVVVEIDNGKLYKYVGNYAHFLEKKQERVENQQTEIDKARNLMRKEYEWIKKQPKARGTKAKYRVEAFEDIKDKAMQKMADNKITISTGNYRMGKKIIELHNISKSLGELPIVNDFEYFFKQRDRIGIVGKNGVGKTTFLNLLTGALTPDKGHISKGDNTQIGYYTQHSLSLPNDKRVIEVIKDIAEVITTANNEVITASQLLTLFQFPPKTQYSVVENLSGGERRRLQLLTVLMKNPNFLILDEPTNDLDIQTLNILEDYLDSFGGVLILVSHDRYFMDRLVEHLFVFEGNGVVRDFAGNYTDYREWTASQPTETATKPAKTEKNTPTPTNNTTSTAATANTAKKKLSFKEKQEYEKLPTEIEQLETEKQGLLDKMNSGSSNHEELFGWSKRIEEITSAIDEKSMRWLELSELA